MMSMGSLLFIGRLCPSLWGSLVGTAQQGSLLVTDFARLLTELPGEHSLSAVGRLPSSLHHSRRKKSDFYKTSNLPEGKIEREMNHSPVKQLHVGVRKNKKLCWFKYSLEVKKTKAKKT